MTNPLKDTTGQEHNDELSAFLQWYLPNFTGIYVPVENGVHCCEDIFGVTIYRHPPFQVQLFITAPNTIIPEHVHPNVDSYEVALTGMEFNCNGRVVMPMWFNTSQDDINAEAKKWNLAKGAYNFIRIKPDTKHGAKSSTTGGAFMSVQHWLHGVEPTSVGNDWFAEATMGTNHTSQVLTTEIQTT